MTEASGLSSAGVSVEPDLLAEAVSQELAAMLQAGNYDAVKLLLEPVQPVDIAEAIGSLPANLQAIAFRLLSKDEAISVYAYLCLLYTSPSPRDLSTSRMPSSA